MHAVEQRDRYRSTGGLQGARWGGRQGTGGAPALCVWGNRGAGNRGITGETRGGPPGPRGFSSRATSKGVGRTPRAWGFFATGYIYEGLEAHFPGLRPFGPREHQRILKINYYLSHTGVQW